MLRVFKKCFFTGPTFLSTLTSVNLLISISMNNQECKVRTQIVNVNGDDPVFFPYSVKTSKSSGSCNNINNPLTKRIEWHETCKCKCRFSSSVCNNKR